VSVVRRCVDLADLLATAATGQAQGRAAVGRPAPPRPRRARPAGASRASRSSGSCRPGDEEAERRLRAARRAPRAAVGQHARGPVQRGAAGGHGAQPPSAGERAALADPGALPDLPPPPEPVDVPDTGSGTGPLVAVWGPTGRARAAPRVAVTLASELAALDHPTALVDADVYGGVVAQVLGLLDESPGLAAACRLANTGALDLPALAGLARR
jgi:Mrp family chromosome partitioning ATPase